MNALKRVNWEPWETDIATEVGQVRWVSVGGEGDPPKTLWHLMVELDAGPATSEGGTLWGYLSVENPAWIDDDVRRPEDPVDLRVHTIWLHPRLRGHRIGTALGMLAKEHRLFESHSLERTPGGTKWAQSLGDVPPPITEEVDETNFDRGGKFSYGMLLERFQDLRGLPFSG